MNERTCSVDGCDREFDAKGYCSKHYARWRRYGSPMGPGCKICGAEAAEGRSAYCSDACAALGAEAIWRRSWEKAKGSPERKAQVAAASRRYYERIRGDEALWRDRLNATAEWRKRNAERLAEQNLGPRISGAAVARLRHSSRMLTPKSSGSATAECVSSAVKRLTPRFRGRTSGQRPSTTSSR